MGYLKNGHENWLYNDYFGFMKDVFLLVIVINLVVHVVPYIINRLRNRGKIYKSYISVILICFWRIILIAILTISWGVIFMSEDEGYTGKNETLVESLSLLVIMTILKIGFDYYDYKRQYGLNEDEYLLRFRTK
jgi:hypothetical protein